MILSTSEVDKIFIGQILNERTKVALVLHSFTLHVSCFTWSLEMFHLILYKFFPHKAKVLMYSQITRILLYAEF